MHYCCSGKVTIISPHRQENLNIHVGYHEVVALHQPFFLIILFSSNIFYTYLIQKAIKRFIMITQIFCELRLDRNANHLLEV